MEPVRSAVDPARRPDPVRRWADRPVAATAAIGVVFVALQVWWISANRRVGAFNVDEEGGLWAAFRFRRALGDGPAELLRSMFSTRNGPLVPLLSVPGLVVGPASPTTAMIVQPVLVVVAACAVAGLVARLSGSRWAAVAGGIATMCLPVSVVSSRSYLYGTGVAAFLALALWALAASQRGSDRRRMLAFGLAIGAMLLCRTMSAGLLPGVVVAVAVTVRGRAARINAVLAAAVAVVVAGPWWIAQFSGISEYLSSYGYGNRAAFYGSTSWAGRLGERASDLASDTRSFLLAAVIAVVAGVWSRTSTHRAGAAAHEGTTARRGPELIVLAVVVGAGFVATLSTANSGAWFGQPLDVLLVALVAGAAARAAVDGPDPARRLAVVSGVIAVAVGVAGLAVSTTVPSSDGLARGDWRQAVVGEHVLLQGGNLDADRRLRSEDDSVRDEAAAEWHGAALAVADLVQRRIDEEGTVLQTVAGERHLFNSNTLGLTEELADRGVSSVEVVNSFEPPDRELETHLSPRPGGVARVLVIIDGRSEPLLDGRGSDRFERLARRAGWAPSDTVVLPDGGRVVVWDHR